MPGQKRSYQLKLTVYPEYLYADLKSDTISIEIIRDYVAEIVAKCDETGLRRILLYRDIPAVLSGVDVFHSVNESLVAFSGKKLALVNPHDAIRNDVEFGMTVGQNRGGNYRSFKTVEEAETWLLETR